jgi:peptidoglycan/LPS O-acetylase OafA/YrhL
MSTEPSGPDRRRFASLAGLLACIAAIAVVTAWFHEESKGDYRRAGLMLGGFAIASLIVCANSPSLTAASIRMAVGAALMLASVAWAMLAPISVGWQYRSAIHWVGYWALATVVLPMLVGPALVRRWAASGRPEWVHRLKQVPAGFLLFLLTMVLYFAMVLLVQVLSPLLTPRSGVRRPVPYSVPAPPPPTAPR